MRLLILLCALLASCGGGAIVHTPVEVKVPVAVKCKVSKPVAPSNPYKGVSDTSLYSTTVLLIKENVDYILYSKKLEAALEACSE